MQKFIVLIVVLTGIAFYSCKKETFITGQDANISFSRDSIKFDTIFTSIGSVTHSFKIFNDNGQKLLISTIKLTGGSGSPFKINIDGAATTESHDIELAAYDSMYVFVSVTINPAITNQPFIINDSILINYNGVSKFVQLQAYGQRANFINNLMVTGNQNWTDTLPYVITGGLQIDTTAILTIAAGTKIYVHANAPFLIDGTIILNGTKAKNIIFASDRLDDPYRDFPAGWPGIFIRNTSINNIFNFAVIKNAYQGIVITGPSLNSNPKLVLTRSIIDNAYNAGMLCTNTSVMADNILISNCGRNIVIEGGGNYKFTYCTLAAYSTQFMIHVDPVLQISNAELINGVIISRDLVAQFQNSIMWGDYGNVDNELLVNKQGSTVFDVTIDHCLYKALTDPANTNLNAVIKNTDPLFDSIDVNHNYFDFRISKQASAPGIDKGVNTIYIKDLDDNNRNVGLPDLGCYEKQ